MQRLYGGPNPQRAFIIYPKQPRGMQHQERTQPFAPCGYGIAHGLLDPGLATFWDGKKRIQGSVDQLGGSGYGLG